MVSKNFLAALIGLQSINAEISRHAAAELSQTRKQLAIPGLPGDLESTTPDDLDLDIVALLQIERLDRSRRQAYRQTVAPFRDSHDSLTNALIRVFACIPKPDSAIFQQFHLPSPRDFPLCYQ